MQFSPDGSKLASISDDSKVIVWDPSTGAWLYTLKYHTDVVRIVQFSPDGSKLASASDDKKVMVWDSSTGARLHTLYDLGSGTIDLQFSPDSSKLASARVTGNRESFISVWDPNVGAKLRDMWYPSTLGAIQFSPDSSRLALASYDSKVILCDPSTGAYLHTLEGHSGKVSSVQFSPDGSKLASASDDSKVIFWDTSTGVQLRTLEGHSGRVSAIQFSPDGSKLASASHNGKILLWDLSKISTVETIDERGHVSDLAFSPDGFYLKTNTGGFKLKSAEGVSSDENACYLDLQVREDWLLRHGHKMIWLPPGLRAFQDVASFPQAIMALGHSSGTVSFWQISA